MLIYLEEVCSFIDPASLSKWIQASEDSLKKLMGKKKFKKIIILWSKSPQRTNTQMEVELLQNVPFSWKQDQKNNILR